MAYLQLSRHEEALVFFKYAHGVFDIFLGSSHPRTITASRNLAAAKKVRARRSEGSQ